MSGVSDTSWLLEISYTKWVIICLGGVINTSLGHVTLLLRINILHVSCLMKCGSSPRQAGRPLLFDVHLRFNSHSDGHSRGYRLDCHLLDAFGTFTSDCLISINPCGDPHTGVMIKMLHSQRHKPQWQHSYGDLTISLWLWANGSPLLRCDGGGLSL